VSPKMLRAGKAEVGRWSFRLFFCDRTFVL
jgi:hypothetical protein